MIRIDMDSIIQTSCIWLKIPKEKYNNDEWRFVILYPIITSLFITIRKIKCHIDLLNFETELNDEIISLISICFASITVFEMFMSIFFVLVLWVFAFFILKKIRSQEEYEKEYNPKLYATLQSEKAEYTLIGGGFSIGTFISADIVSNFQLEFLAFGGYVLLLLGIYYRHITYGIYLQETKKP